MIIASNAATLGSRIWERTVFPQSQRKVASLSSSIHRWPPLLHSRSLRANVKTLQRIIKLKKEAGPASHPSYNIAPINGPSFASAYILRSVTELRNPVVSIPKEGESRSISSDSDGKEPDMKDLNGTWKDEIALGGNARVHRVNSSNRLIRQHVKFDDESEPLSTRQNSYGDESEPLLTRHNSKYDNAANLGRKTRKRRNVMELQNPPRQHSFKDDVGHAAAETFLLTRLTFSLLRYLGVGYRWMVKFAALTLYAFFLMPGFVQVGYAYFFDKSVRRSIVYGNQPRNRLDLYTPENSKGPYPVLIFVTGGAWIIGYKAWGALLGLQLSRRGIMVCCTDYRNFPQGTISDMVEDVTSGIGFVADKIEDYGGDPDRIYIAGQSAGCHLATCAIVEQARIEIGQKEGDLTWSPSQFKGYLGLSGGYNLCELVDHFHKRGLYKRIFLSIMEGEESLPLYSPALAVRSDAFTPAVSLLPPIHLFHGTADKSIPCTASTNFKQALEEVGASAFVKLYRDKTHTDVFIQDPMRGGVDELFEDFVGVIYADDQEARAEAIKSVAKSTHRRRLVPEFLLRWARAVSPF